MFQMTIAVISLALVSVLAVSTMYFGHQSLVVRQARPAPASADPIPRGTVLIMVLLVCMMLLFGCASIILRYSGS